jgi:hypothetical protein
MFKTLIESLRKKSFSLSDLPETIRVPGHGGRPTIDGLRLEDASVDDIAFAIRGMSDQTSLLLSQESALRRLHDLARNRGAIGTDTVSAIFGGEV